MRNYRNGAVIASWSFAGREAAQLFATQWADARGVVRQLYSAGCQAGPLGVLLEHDRERQARAVAPRCSGCWRRCSSATPSGSWIRPPSIALSVPQAPEAGRGPYPAGAGISFFQGLLQAAIPELLMQTGTSGRQFAHLLIRTHQEMSQQRLPGARAQPPRASASANFRCRWKI